jgi:AcrR family transcriptional regulator
MNPRARALRRDAFIRSGTRLIQTKGYEQMSVQDVLDDLGASRGAFYHYFPSKQALLEAVVDHVVISALGTVAPITAELGMSAISKLRGIFTGIAGWKEDRRPLMLALLRVWHADDNVLTRDKLRGRLMASLVPMLAEIIVQGVGEGSMSAGSPDGAARALVSLLLGAQDAAVDLFLAGQDDEVPYRAVSEVAAGYTEAMERVLGLPPGSLNLFSEERVRPWFDAGRDKAPKAFEEVAEHGFRDPY